MKRVGQMTFSYGPEISKNARWRETLEAHAAMMTILEESERHFIAGPIDDIDRIRFACTDVLIAVSNFAKRMGVTGFGEDRLDELVLSFARANWGQSAPLLDRAKGHWSLSPCDRTLQGAAQTCVELYRAAGLPANEARKRVARRFFAKKVKGLGVQTLAKPRWQRRKGRSLL